MKVGLTIVLIITVLVGGIVGFFYYRSNQAPTQSVASTCNDPAGINSHVYNPDRLKLVKSCIFVSGTVDALREERDGDYHVLLRLDSAYDNLTNNENAQYQNGDLVAEIICVLNITQSDAESACQNYVNHIPIPSVDQHITVSGPYVMDTDHYGWAEIHPVFSLRVS